MHYIEYEIVLHAPEFIMFIFLFIFLFIYIFVHFQLFLYSIFLSSCDTSPNNTQSILNISLPHP